MTRIIVDPIDTYMNFRPSLSDSPVVGLNDELTLSDIQTPRMCDWRLPAFIIEYSRAGVRGPKLCGWSRKC